MGNKKEAKNFLIKVILTIVIILVNTSILISNFIYDFHKFSCCGYANSDSKPIYNFKKIDIDSKGNIFISNNNYIQMFNEKGLLMCYWYYNVDFDFKIHNDTLEIVSDDKILLSEDDEKENPTGCIYVYNLNNVYKDYEYSKKHNYFKSIMSVDTIKLIKYDYKQFLKDNSDFKTSNCVIKNNKKYEYSFYGKVMVNENGVKHKINLDVPRVPIPLFHCIIIELIIYIFVKIIIDFRAGKKINSNIFGYRNIDSEKDKL